MFTHVECKFDAITALIDHLIIEINCAAKSINLTEILRHFWRAVFNPQEMIAHIEYHFQTINAMIKRFIVGDKLHREK
jgi:hypothetical protein